MTPATSSVRLSRYRARGLTWDLFTRTGTIQLLPDADDPNISHRAGEVTYVAANGDRLPTVIEMVGWTAIAALPVAPCKTASAALEHHVTGCDSGALAVFLNSNSHCSST
jgi:hypothetical protein